MTKKKAFALARELSVRCDEAHVFAVKIGAGCLCDVVCKKGSWEIVTLFINLLERTMNNLKAEHQDEFRKLIIEALQLYLDDEEPPKSKPEILSDKLRAKRIKANEKILSTIDEILNQEDVA